MELCKPNVTFFFFLCLNHVVSIMTLNSITLKSVVNLEQINEQIVHLLNLVRRVQWEYKNKTGVLIDLNQCNPKGQRMNVSSGWLYQWFRLPPLTVCFRRHRWIVPYFGLPVVSVLK